MNICNNKKTCNASCFAATKNKPLFITLKYFSPTYTSIEISKLNRDFRRFFSCLRTGNERASHYCLVRTSPLKSYRAFLAFPLYAIVQRFKYIIVEAFSTLIGKFVTVLHSRDVTFRIGNMIALPR